MYDQRCKKAKFEISNIVLVRQSAWKDRHEIQDSGEEEEYKIIAQLSLGVLAYKIQKLNGNKLRILYRNLLLTLQGN